jgi:hypothetical protein
MVRYNSAYNAPPFAQLLKMGDARKTKFDASRYEQMGFTDEHVPMLIQLATDDYLLWEWDDKHPDLFWAPIHTWRVLAKLRPDAAIKPLVALFDIEEENDVILDDLPEVLAMFGESAIDPLRSIVNRYDVDDQGITAATTTLTKIAAQFPATRSRCVEAITSRLRDFQRNDDGLNGFLIADLCDLRAAEAAEVIKAAFYAKAVDLTITGNWFDVKPDLGLADDVLVAGPEPDNDPIPRLLPNLMPLLEALDAPPTSTGAMPYSLPLINQLQALTGDTTYTPKDYLEDESPSPQMPVRNDKQKKAKRKQAKQSRKQNRKKKK